MKLRCSLFYFFTDKKLMNSIVFFYNEKGSNYKDEKVFGGKSAVELTHSLMEQSKFDTVSDIITIDGPLSLCELLEKLSSVCDEKKADFVIFSYNDLPFLDRPLIEELIKSHVEYKAEYTFADGYPYGFTPELLDSGTIKILSQLAKTTQKQLGSKKTSRDSIFELIKTDINSFEVETILAPNDWRLYRFAFHCGTKDNFLQSKALYDQIKGKELSADEKSKLASECLACLKTVPGFFNVQIAQKTNILSIYSPYKTKENGNMDYEKFSNLVDKIAKFSERAVISLSAWGEPLCNSACLKMIKKVLSYQGLSVFMETDGLLVTQDFCNELKKIVEEASERNNGYQKFMAAVTLDAFTKETYAHLHPDANKAFGEDAFEKAINAVNLLCQAVPGMVYPQFVRMNDNENELESFFRYWNEKTNATGGNFIIQKYDDFAGLLPPCKPADLSPIERFPCWHCRRDLTILWNGDVPPCRTYLNSEILGNVFSESLEEIWKKTDSLLEGHVKQKYNEKCGKCDEYYTFNF